MATISVTVPDAAVTRIRNAVAAVTGVPAPATAAQTSDLIRTYLRDLCVQVEHRTRAATVPTDADTAVEADFPKPVQAEKPATVKRARKAKDGESRP